MTAITLNTTRKEIDPENDFARHAATELPHLYRETFTISSASQADCIILHFRITALLSGRLIEIQLPVAGNETFENLGKLWFSSMKRKLWNFLRTKFGLIYNLKSFK